MNGAGFNVLWLTGPKVFVTPSSTAGGRGMIVLFFKKTHCENMVEMSHFSDLYN